MKNKFNLFLSVKELLRFLFAQTKKIIVFAIVLILVAKIVLWLDINGLLFGSSRLVIATDPGGAEIFINWKHKGKSPVKQGDRIEIQIREGRYTVAAVIPSAGPREKYAITEPVTVAKGSREFLTLTLQDRVSAEFKKKLQDKYGGGIPLPTMVPIPGGSFIMGDAGGSAAEKPAHNVILSPFLLSATEVTFDQYDACVVAGGCDHCPDDRGWGRGDRPVINVSWQDAQQYLTWLKQRTGKGYRLPTEAEWEYAARAGSTSKYSFGADIGSNLANCDGCGSRWDDKQTAPVGRFPANAFGLYDMHGNVREWCQDWYYDKYYLISPTRDPQGLSSGSSHVVRGGGWFFPPDRLGSAKRDEETPDDRYDVGFRLAQPAEGSVYAQYPLYVGQQVYEPGCSAGSVDGLDPLELWFETVADGFISGWLRSHEVVGSFSGASSNALKVTWPTHGAEEVLGETSFALVHEKGQLRAVLTGVQSKTEADPCHSGRMVFILNATADDYVPWLARTENDYLVKKFLSEARYWRKQQDYSQARSWYENALELKGRLGWGESLAAAEIMDSLAGLNFQMTYYSSAIEYAQRALAIWRRLQGDADRDVLVRTLRLAWYHHELHDYATAKGLLTQGLAAIETTPGQKGKQAFLELLADINTCMSDEETSQRKRETDANYDLGHSALTMAIRHGDDAEAVRLIDASPDSSWLVVWKVFREIAEPGKQVLVLGEGEEAAPYPLLAAVAALGNEPVARALLRKGAQVDARLPDGSTPLMFAAKMRHLAMVRLLLAAGADSGLKTRTKWPTAALGFALDLAESGEDERVALELLQPYYAKLKVAGYTIRQAQNPLAGYSPLQLRVLLETAAYRGLGQVVRRMAELGAPLQGRNQLGATLLHYSLMGERKGCDEVAFYLIENGADPNRYYATDQQLATAKAGGFEPHNRREGKTPLLLAIDEGADDAFIERLLQLGADASLPSLSGVTPLQLAGLKERKALVKLLRTMIRRN